MADTSWTTLTTGLITGLGIGSITTVIVQHSLKKREAAYQSQRKDLEERYRVIILLMYAAHNFAGNETTMRVHRPDLKDRGAVLDELKAEWTNMLLFASGATLDALQCFISSPSIDLLLKTAMSMRCDLGRSNLRLDTQRLFQKS